MTELNQSVKLSLIPWRKTLHRIELQTWLLLMLEIEIIKCSKTKLQWLAINFYLYILTSVHQ